MYHSTRLYNPRSSYISSISTTTYRSRPRGPPPTSAQVRRVAAAAIATLETIGVKACFVGGMACYLFGNLRQPNVGPSSSYHRTNPTPIETDQDVDILCLDWNLGQEALKSKLVSLNSSFYLVAARNPLASYKVLWYRLADTDSAVKVDLLFPGILNIPSIPSSAITSQNAHKLPCAPFSLVLLLKLQAWIHHGDALEYRYKAKQPMDARDIEALLPLAVKQGVRPRSDGFLPQSFVADAAKHVGRFVRDCPNTRRDWETLGLIEPKKQIVSASSSTRSPATKIQVDSKAKANTQRYRTTPRVPAFFI